MSARNISAIAVRRCTVFIVTLCFALGVQASPPRDGWAPTQEDLVVYRVYGGKAGPEGPRDRTPTADTVVYYSLTKPTYREAVRNSNSLPPSNSATHYDVVRIKAGTPIGMGDSAAMQWKGDKVTRRPGGGNEIMVRYGDVRGGSVEVLDRGRKLSYGQNLAPRFDLEAQLNRSQKFSEVWYRVQEEGRYWRDSNYSVRAQSTQSAVVTDQKTVSDTVNAYGKFPGGVLLEAVARFDDGTRLRSLALNLDDLTLVINDNCKYDPGLTLEELALLWKYTFSSSDYHHFGAVSQQDFRGVPRDSIVALWLGLADSELGGYAYGYDIQTELFKTNLPNFTNAQLLELEAVANMDAAALRRAYYLQIHALQPRLYLKTHAVEAVCASGTLRVRKHAVDIHFQVFNESPDGSASFTPLAPEALTPEEAIAVKWISRNLAKIATHSPSFQRILRYSEVLSLMRLARQRGVTVQNQETLRIAYKTRQHLEHRFDIYQRADDKRVGPKARTEIENAVRRLEKRYRQVEKDLPPHERVIVLSNLLALAWWLSDENAKGLAGRYGRELDGIVRRFGGGKGISSVQEGEIAAVKTWVSAQRGLE